MWSVWLMVMRCVLPVSAATIDCRREVCTLYRTGRGAPSIRRGSRRACRARSGAAPRPPHEPRRSTARIRSRQCSPRLCRDSTATHYFSIRISTDTGVLPCRSDRPLSLDSPTPEFFHVPEVTNLDGRGPAITRRLSGVGHPDRAGARRANRARDGVGDAASDAARDRSPSSCLVRSLVGGRACSPIDTGAFVAVATA